MECIDLRKQFGRKYRLQYERPLEDPRARVRAPDPWLMMMLCRYGHIYPMGGDRLAAYVDGHRGVAGRLRRLTCCEVHQDGDDGHLTVVFALADFAKVAEIMRPLGRRRVTMTTEQRQAIGERLKQARTLAQHAAAAQGSPPAALVV